MRGVTQQVVIAGFKGLFQPALPMRGVTRPSDMSILSVLISTRTPHAGSDFVPVGIEITNEISTRTPHAGSDRGAHQRPAYHEISTRTPHAGSDRS